MSDFVQSSQDLLDSADRAFDAGDVRAGSRLMWEAARTAIDAVAIKHGWPCDSLEEIKEVIYRLDGVDEKGNSTGFPWYFMHFGVANTFREHAETYEWEYPEFQWGDSAFRMGRKSVKKFVDSLMRYAETERRVQ